MDIHLGKKTIGKKESAFFSQLANGISTCIGNLLKFAAHLEQQGKSEYIEQREITGKTRSGKEIRGAYGCRIKIGLDKIQHPRTEKHK
ncbi:MAG: hypothetical protein V1698_03395 [bacterium]